MLDNLKFGLYLTAVGMGTVFLLLAALMGLLMLLTWLDKPQPEPTPVLTSPPASVEIDADGLDADVIAAITVAVMKHAQVRRKQAAPEMRTHQPGSLLHLSRWLAVGRGQQNQQWRRR